MKLDGSTIPIEKRGFGEAVDLAGRLWVTELRPIVKITLWFAVPSCAAVYALTHHFERGFVWAFSTFYFLAPVAGAAIVAGVGPRVFGDPFVERRALLFFLTRLGPILTALWGPRSLWFAGMLVLYGSGGLSGALTVAAVFVFFWGMRTSLVREVILLESLDGRRARRRLVDLRRGSGGARLGWHLGGLALFAFLTSVLVGLVDLIVTWVFETPIIFGRLSMFERGFQPADLFYQLNVEPLAITAVSAAAWFAYPLVRIVLFLFYLDSRISREGWDIELDFRVEATRLEASI